MSTNNIKKNIDDDGVHGYGSDKDWVMPDDAIVLEKLEWFRDQKLGLMMHWGPYSQMGTYESWPLCDVAAHWSRSEVDWVDDVSEFKRQYYDLNKTFNPIKFNPELWAELASENGFKYLLFTTKHHDGFCMWDTQTTDYKITGQDCPFHTNKNADVCKSLFNAFREKGLAIAAYFSKPDWHVDSYWTKGFKSDNDMTSAPSYNTKEYPWIWNQFVDFAHNQIMELMSKYGKIDVLWLDGGVVSPKNDLDIRLGEVVKKAREKQPGLLVVDRTVGGEYENYLTPEKVVPAYPMNAPWESCISMTKNFSYRYENNFKSFREILLLLVDIISKGGNLALNVAPQPDGRLPALAITRMKELGAWLKINGEAVYGTRVHSPYRVNNCAFTCKEDTAYCFYIYEEGQSVVDSVFLPYSKEINTIELLGNFGTLEFDRVEEGVNVKLPQNQLHDNEPIVQVFKIK